MRLLLILALEALIALVIVLYLGNPIPWFQKQFAGEPSVRQVATGSPGKLEPEYATPSPTDIGDTVGAQHHHPHIPSSQCFAPPTRAISEATGPVIYRWENERGHASFGDRPPPGVQAALVTPSANAPRYFLLDVKEVGQQQVPFLRAHIETNSRRIFQAFQGFLGKDRLRQVEMNVTIFEHRGDFRQHATRTGADRSADALGYYRLPENAIYTFQQHNDRNTLNTATHEAVHVMVAGLLGPTTPLWLNEGLATYFSTIEVAAQYGVVPPNHSHLALARRSVRTGYPGRLINFLEYDSEQWHNSNRSVHYALAWALTWFLLETDEGRHAITALMQMKAEAFCEPPDHQLWLARSYPGGIQGLQNDFYGWLGSAGQLPPHRH
ncbi:MAG: DUF1570 domain-containing protein [Pseudohongiellaceae bacterium]